MSLRDAQAAVHRFMVKAGQETPERPTWPSGEVQGLRVKLHHEEAVTELVEAFSQGSMEKMADSIADSLVVILGTAVACGIDIEPIFQEVMRSNMSKFIDGHRREDGKWLKGPSYSPANIAPLIEEQLKGNREPDFWLDRSTWGNQAREVKQS